MYSVCTVQSHAATACGGYCLLLAAVLTRRHDGPRERLLRDWALAVNRQHAETEANAFWVKANDATNVSRVKDRLNLQLPACLRRPRASGPLV